MRKSAAWAAIVAVAAVAGWAAWRAGWFRPAPPSVLLVSIDTLRADRLGSYGYAAAATPALDALAARGLRFDQAATVAPLTLPAHASLLTGTFPSFHGIRDNGGFYLGDDLVTLAEVLAGQGYRTGGFVGAFVLDRRWGIAQGFDRYFDDFDLSKYDTAAGLDVVQRPAPEVVDRALAWLGEDATRPFFAWVHLYDPHAPYAAPDAYRSRFPATMHGAYDAEVAATDAAVGRLFDALAASGRLDNTVVIVVGDHGESLGEHKEQQHGFFLYDSVMRIPLIIAGPGVPAAVVPDQVRIVDVMPTVLDLLGVGAPTAVQGASLLPLTRGERLDLLAFAETWYPRYHYNWSELKAVRDGRYKYIAAPRRELYDTSQDPGETHDLSAANPRLADALAAALADLERRMAEAATPQAPRAVEPEVEERLRALGYVGASVSRAALADGTRRDPKDAIDLYNLIKRAGEDSVNGRLDAGIAKLGEVLAVDPGVIEAHTMIGNMHVKANRLDAAIDAYRRALAIDPEHEGTVWSLALAYRRAGRLEEAEAGFDRVLELNPRNTRVNFQRADLYMRRGEFDRAIRELEQGLAGGGDRAPFLVKLAEVRIELGQHDQAEAALLDALRAKADQPMAHFDLGLVHEARGRAADAMAAYREEIRVSPTLFQPHFNLARLLMRDGKPGEAAAHFREAVTLNPDHAPGYLYLSKTLLDTGDLAGAEKAAREGLAKRPDAGIAPLGHFVLADVYSRLGRERDAAREAAAGRRLQRQGAPPGTR
ncbi:MAG: sulfatase-like hydrolase/transferase [Acidobacteriota bacterium]